MRLGVEVTNYIISINDLKSIHWIKLNFNLDADYVFSSLYKVKELNFGSQECVNWILAGVQGINLFVSSSSTTFLFVSLNFVEYWKSYTHLNLTQFPATSVTFEAFSGQTTTIQTSCEVPLSSSLRGLQLSFLSCLISLSFDKVMTV